MADAHADMLDLAVKLAQQEAAGHTLSPAERAISDILWIGTQVSPNGFDGWLAYTPCERMCRTLEALRQVGCTEVLDVVTEALAAARVDPHRMSDEERERQVDALSDDDRRRLEAADSRFYDVYEPSMEVCERYARQNGIL